MAWDVTGMAVNARATSVLMPLCTPAYDLIASVTLFIMNADRPAAPVATLKSFVLF
jgi:hypothetical protein